MADKSASKGGSIIGAILALVIVLGIWYLAKDSRHNKLPGPQLQQALQAIQHERHVIKAAWQDPAIPSLVVTVNDDGQNRDGLARTYCLMLSGQGIYGGVVHIIDAHRQGWHQLGKAWCPQK